MFDKLSFLQQRYDELVTALKNSSYLGVRNIIIHPLQHLRYYTGENIEALYEMNIEFYKKLLPLCEEYGITICTENMWQCYGNSDKIWDSTCSRAEEFARYIDGVASPYLKACVDLGHTVLVGENPERMLRVLGSRVAALHVHDNRFGRDSHDLPYFGTADWESFYEGLKDVGYTGVFNLETAPSWKLAPDIYDDMVRILVRIAKQIMHYDQD